MAADRIRRAGGVHKRGEAYLAGTVRASFAPEPLEPAMSTFTFNEFEASARAQGFDEVIERVWEPLTLLDTHTHPFAVKALVTRGEVWLGVGSESRHLRAGDTFELAHGVAHAERYGSEGATFWVARRHAVGAAIPEGASPPP